MTVSFPSSMRSFPPRAEYRARISAAEGVEAHFHVWHGVSGKRYLHTVYTPGDEPLLVRAIVIVVERTGSTRRILHMEQAGATALRLENSAKFRAALKAGGNEVHVHFIARSDEERRRIVEDLDALTHEASETVAQPLAELAA